MQCKSCQVELSAATAHQVAHWSFCDPCFQRLFDKPAPAEPVGVEAAAEDAPPWASAEVHEEEALPTPPGGPATSVRLSVSISGPKPSATPPRSSIGSCRLCSAPLEAGKFVDYSFWKLCSECAAQVDALSEQLETLPHLPEVPAEEPGPPPLFSTFVDCTGCGRNIPRGGAKARGEGNYCPDCFRNLPAEVPASAGSVTADVAASGGHVATTPPEAAASPILAPDGACEACSRPLGAGGGAVHSGFRLCEACVRADVEDAVQTAAARHRAHLRRLRAQFDA